MQSDATGKLLGGMSRDQLDRLAAALTEMRVCWDVVVGLNRAARVLAGGPATAGSVSAANDGPFLAERLLEALRADVDNRA